MTVTLPLESTAFSFTIQPCLGVFRYSSSSYVTENKNR